jgi:transposase
MVLMKTCGRRERGMPRTARKVECDEAMRQELVRLSRSQKDEARLVRRARMVLGCVEGRRIKELAAEIGEQQDVIIKWRDRFVEGGLPGLLDKSRSGKPVTFGDEWKASVLAKLDEKPPHGFMTLCQIYAVRHWIVM